MTSIIAARALAAAVPPHPTREEAIDALHTHAREVVAGQPLDLGGAAEALGLAVDPDQPRITVAWLAPGGETEHESVDLAKGARDDLGLTAEVVAALAQWRESALDAATDDDLGAVTAALLDGRAPHVPSSEIV